MITFHQLSVHAQWMLHKKLSLSCIFRLCMRAYAVESESLLIRCMCVCAVESEALLILYSLHVCTVESEALLLRCMYVRAGYLEPWYSFSQLRVCTIKLVDCVLAVTAPRSICCCAGATCIQSLVC